VKEETKNFLKELLQGGWKASSIGLSLVLAIAIGGLIGYWLWGVFDLFLYRPDSGNNRRFPQPLHHGEAVQVLRAGWSSLRPAT